jgi:hypothetical protein
MRGIEQIVVLRGKGFAQPNPRPMFSKSTGVVMS